MFSTSGLSLNTFFSLLPALLLSSVHIWKDEAHRLQTPLRLLLPFQVSHGYLLGAGSFERGVWMDGLRFIKRFSSVYFHLAALKPLRLNATRWLPQGTWRFPDTNRQHQCASDKTYCAFQCLRRSPGETAVFVRVLFLTREEAMLIFLLLYLIKTDIKSELLGELDPKGQNQCGFSGRHSRIPCRINRTATGSILVKNLLH